MLNAVFLLLMKAIATILEKPSNAQILLSVLKKKLNLLR